MCKGPTGMVQSNLCKSIMFNLIIDYDADHGDIHNNDGGTTMTMKTNNKINCKTKLMTIMLKILMTVTMISGN